MSANWRSTNSRNVVYINTDLHRATLLDEDVSYPLELGQGRHATNPVPAVSMFAGKPEQPLKLNKAALAVWAVYWGIVIAAICAVVMP